jgi:gluconokinase
MSLTKPILQNTISTAQTSTIAQFNTKTKQLPAIRFTVTHLVIMGVSGCGKTSLGTQLAAALDWPFFDADDFHPPENVAKMRAGVPLTDEDRAPWLVQLNRLLQANPHAVLACSALKSNYRDALQAGLPHLRFIHPHGAFEVIAKRIEARAKETGHYMPASLLKSQFEALEPCASALRVDIEMPRSERVAYVLDRLS